MIGTNDGTNNNNVITVKGTSEGHTNVKVISEGYGWECVRACTRVYACVRVGVWVCTRVCTRIRVHSRFVSVDGLGGCVWTSLRNYVSGVRVS